jgi:hypothetical protein
MKIQIFTISDLLFIGLIEGLLKGAEKNFSFSYTREKPRYAFLSLNG